MERLKSGPVAHHPVQGGAKPLPLQVDSAPARRYEVGPPSLPRLRQTGAWEKVKDLALRFAVKVAPGLVRSDFMCRRAEQAMGPKVRDLAIALGKQPPMAPAELNDRLEDIRDAGFALRSRDDAQGGKSSAYTQGLEAAVVRSVSLNPQTLMAVLFGAMDALGSSQLQQDTRPLQALLAALGLRDCSGEHHAEMATVNPAIAAGSTEYLPEQQGGNPELMVSNAFKNDFLRGHYATRKDGKDSPLIGPADTVGMTEAIKLLFVADKLLQVKGLCRTPEQLHALSCVADQRGFTGIINAQAARMTAGEKSLTRGAGIQGNEFKHWTLEAMSDGSVLVRGVRTSAVNQVMHSIGEVPKPIKPTYELYAYETSIRPDGTVTPGRAFSAHGPIEELA